MFEEDTVKIIPINLIRIINPRDRDPKKFERIVRNIAALGLKRPITVNKPKKKKDGKPFELFNQQEVIHLEDVKGLIWLDYRVLHSHTQSG